MDLAGRHDVVMLKRWEDYSVRIPLDGGEVLLPIIIAPVNGFRPIMVDLTSRDRRWLGCFVRLSFE